MERVSGQLTADAFRAGDSRTATSEPFHHLDSRVASKYCRVRFHHERDKGRTKEVLTSDREIMWHVEYLAGRFACFRTHKEEVRAICYLSEVSTSQSVHIRGLGVVLQASSSERLSAGHASRRARDGHAQGAPPSSYAASATASRPTMTNVASCLNALALYSTLT